MQGKLKASEMSLLINAVIGNLPRLGSEEGLDVELAISTAQITNLDVSQVKNILTAFNAFTSMLPASAQLTLKLNVLPSDSRITEFLSAVDRQLKEVNGAQEKKAVARAAVQEAATPVRSVEPAAQVDSVASPAKSA